MNAKTIGGLIVLVIVLAVGWYAFQLQQQTAKWKNAKEIVEESFVKDGGIATIHYVGVINAPIDKVQDAVWSVERVSQMIENFKKSDLIKQEGNSKTVLMQLQALNLPLQQYTMQFTLDAPKHQVSFKTIQAQAADLDGVYKLEPSPDGTKTRITYDVKSTDKIAVPFPAAVIESANREVFVNTVRGIEKSLNGAAPAPAG
jgi:ribosome-associated toxin RatA of RatAB toxin-antitoxin module